MSDNDCCVLFLVYTVGLPDTYSINESETLELERK